MNYKEQVKFEVVYLEDFVDSVVLKGKGKVSKDQPKNLANLTEEPLNWEKINLEVVIRLVEYGTSDLLSLFKWLLSEVK